MAITNHERVGKALEILKVGLAPFVEHEIKSAIASNSISMARVREFVDDPKPGVGDSGVALVGAQVTVTLEIHADIPSGAPDNVVRTVTENSRTLKFSELGFEKE